ncbi:hypothetical protein LMH87_012206 [Akanthomyces muscarius]|uniref:Uncharacterized protein n=1 Tax=Akanthomyces muscarius TaxID=2231603 RepID=A0A9W8QE19_AKAMU|nr:hypothetical protein LMH87_012206 [Akanthomyces muscarius]KAJ4151513.1 hypothetical protein LMH87_012206 [Akanthomyces muscarius]
MPLFSKYENGKFRSGNWYCGCDEEARWYTSSKEGSKGERFARCKQSGTDHDCKFFLTEKDEAEARLSKSVTVSPSTPRTPLSQRTVEAMPTPNTGSSSRTLFGGGSRARRVASMSDSPTARRFVDADGDDGDLADFVVRQLRQDGIALKSSTESVIRYAIGSRIGKYEAAQKNSNDSLTLALEKLDRLESGASG